MMPCLNVTDSRTDGHHTAALVALMHSITWQKWYKMSWTSHTARTHSQILPSQQHTVNGFG